MPTNIVYLALGTNLGDRPGNLQDATAALSSAVKVLERSPVYETQPWGMTDQPAFLNMVIKGDTHLGPLGTFKTFETSGNPLGSPPFRPLRAA